jgi:hypothetical protein
MSIEDRVIEIYKIGNADERHQGRGASQYKASEIVVAVEPYLQMLQV